MVKTGMPAVNKQKGFTLVELLIAVAIIGILASIALPSYQNYVRTSKRAEAKSDILKIQLGMERWRANNTTYPSTLSNAGFTDNNNYYDYSISGATGSAYTITAAATAGTSQVNDTGCTSLSINQSGTKSPASCW